MAFAASSISKVDNWVDNYLRNRNYGGPIAKRFASTKRIVVDLATLTVLNVGDIDTLWNRSLEVHKQFGNKTGRPSGILEEPCQI